MKVSADKLNQLKSSGVRMRSVPNKEASAPVKPVLDPNLKAVADSVLTSTEATVNALAAITKRVTELNNANKVLLTKLVKLESKDKKEVKQFVINRDSSGFITTVDLIKG